jgi:hypothetical protein
MSSSPWFLTRAYRDTDTPAFRAQLEYTIEVHLGACRRCLDYFKRCGLIPIQCDLCGSVRDILFINTCENLAHRAQALGITLRIPTQSNDKANHAQSTNT